VREFLSVLLASILAASALWSQTSFEVASVKQGAPIPGWPDFFYVMKGGGIETNDPGHFTATGVPLKNLLIERVGLVVQFEPRQGQIYQMLVARAVLKMRPAAAASGPSSPDDSPSTPGSNLPTGITTKKDGTFLLVPGIPNRILYAIDESTTRMTARMQSPAEIVRTIERQTGRTVRDETGLSGRCDFDFTFTRAADTPVPARIASTPGEDFLAAVRSKPGLDLVPSKGPIQVLVVDKWNKAPSAN
jgi:uncharacterized protein (TIGR03435 family)